MNGEWESPRHRCDPPPYEPEHHDKIWRCECGMRWHYWHNSYYLSPPSPMLGRKRFAAALAEYEAKKAKTEATGYRIAVGKE